jgi:N-acetylglucosamine malate deacetylase 1
MHNNSPKTSPLDILAFAAHPDDVEISCAGSLLKASALGKRIGIIDLTKGELGSRGSAALRAEESAAAATLLGLTHRSNLEMEDGFFEVSNKNKLQIVRAIRQFRPKLILCNAPSDRHPDHGRAHAMVQDACFLSGLIKIETIDSNGQPQEAYRPQEVYAYIQDNYLKPNLVVDITGYWEKKRAVLMCYASQFYQPDQEGPQTPISSKEFLDFLYGRGLQFGREAGVAMGEGYITTRAAKIDQIDALV